MEILTNLIRARGTRHAVSLASDVAARCVDAVRARTALRAEELSVAEYKGYVRATALQEAASVVTLGLLRARGLGHEARTQIMVLAADGVAERLVGEAVRSARTRRAA